MTLHTEINWNRATFKMVLGKFDELIACLGELRNVPLTEVLEREVSKNRDAVAKLFKAWNEQLREESER
jgi:hypothetical protein